MAETEQADVAALTVQLLSAYLGNNTVAHTDIPDLVRATRAALVEEAKPASVESETPSYTPAVSVRRSLASPDHLLSLIDGKPYKTLKRHLTSNGLTPEGYRARYNLPASYPMVAPGFAEQRRAIAAKIGLGRRPAVSASAPGENAKSAKETASSEKPAGAGAIKKPRLEQVAKALGPSSTVGDETASPPAPAATPKAPSKGYAGKKAAPKTVVSKAAIAKPAAAKKPVGTRIVKAEKATKPDDAPLVEAKTDPVTLKTDVPAKRVAKANPAAEAAGKPVKRQTSTPATAAPNAPAKAKSGRDKLGLFREVAEAAATRDIKKVQEKNGSAAKAAEPALSDNAVNNLTGVTGSTTPDL